MSNIMSRKQAKANGLTRYFTGKPCKHGHIDYRNTCDCSCFECSRIKAANRRSENPWMVKQDSIRRKERYAEDPETRRKAIDRAARWAAENKENRATYLKSYYRDNREAALAQSKERYQKNRQDPEWVAKERERQAKKNRDNPQHKLSACRTRRARLRGAEGSHNAADVLHILASQDYKCVYCGTCLKSGYDVDHIVAISRGGSNWPSNLQCLCANCNGRKWCKDHEEFAKEIEKEGQ